MAALVVALAVWAFYTTAGLAVMWACHRSMWLLRLAGDPTTGAVMWPLLLILAALSRRPSGSGRGCWPTPPPRSAGAEGSGDQPGGCNFPFMCERRGPESPPP